MSATWRPGTVAMVTYDGRTRIALRGDQGWTFGDLHSWLGDAFEAEVRPLVVIDPADLLDGYDSESGLRHLAAWLRIAADGVDARDRREYGEPPAGHGDILRSIARQVEAQTKPPAPAKPGEPTGLGAVVRDEAGRIYTRYETAGGPTKEPQPWWQSANGPEHDVVRRFGWEDIDAVEVLSEGVTA